MKVLVEESMEASEGDVKLTAALTSGSKEARKRPRAWLRRGIIYIVLGYGVGGMLPHTSHRPYIYIHVD